MQKRTATNAEVKRERDPRKVKSVIKRKGFPSGKLPMGKELHHKKPVALGGKTTLQNTVVILKTKHQKIHASKRKNGLI
jgi:hypothetical protein